MKITGMNIGRVQIPPKELFKVAFVTVSYLESVLIQASTDNGCIGSGEAAPFAPVTGEIVDGVVAALELFKTGLLGVDPMDIEVVHAMMDGVIVGSDVARCAVDLVMYDPTGKSMGLPVYKPLGGYSNVMHNDITIGTSSPQSMAAEVKRLVETEGYHILKIKAGTNYRDDILTMKLIREAVGPDTRLRADTNRDYSIFDMVCTLEGFKKYGIEAVEQCLPRWDMEGSAFIRSKVSGIQIILDESIHDPTDTARARRLGAADTLDTKLMKCGGLYPASKINVVAEANGVTCMIGCMLETKLTTTAGLSLVAIKENVTEADCDSFLYYKENPIEGGFTQERDISTLLDEPGFRVYFNM